MQRFLREVGDLNCSLKKIRLEQNISQLELAKRSGVHRTQINRYESGVNIPSARNLQKLASALNVPVGELLEDETSSAAAPVSGGRLNPRGSRA